MCPQVNWEVDEHIVPIETLHQRGHKHLVPPPLLSTKGSSISIISQPNPYAQVFYTLSLTPPPSLGPLLPPVLIHNWDSSVSTHRLYKIQPQDATCVLHKAYHLASGSISLLLKKCQLQSPAFSWRRSNRTYWNVELSANSSFQN